MIIQTPLGLMRTWYVPQVPSEKVALAQKMMITKANIAGKFVVSKTDLVGVDHTTVLCWLFYTL